MNREEKTAAVEDLAGKIEESEAVYAVDYRGISVSQAAELRRRLRENEATFRVAKNRLTKLAAGRAGQEQLEEFLSGPTALTFVRGDAAATAKTLSDFARANDDVLTFKGGLLGSQLLDPAAFHSIAQLPSRNALEAQLAGVVASPLTGLVRGLGSMISGLAVALQQVADQGLVGGSAPPPASEAPAAEAAADEAPAAEEQASTAEEEAPAGEDEAPAAEADDAEDAPAAEAADTGEAAAEEAPAAETADAATDEAPAEESAEAVEPQEAASGDAEDQDSSAAEDSAEAPKTSENSEDEQE